jgi:hypothetical protein
MSVWRLSFFFLSIVIAGASRTARADTPVRFMYGERPPFTETLPDGSVGGSVGKPVFAAVQQAGIAADWVVTPAARQLETIRQNDSRSCAIGWFKTPERQSFARYTKPVSQDSPTIALANAGFHPPPDITLDALLADPSLDVVVKESLIYGGFLDGKLAAMKAHRQITAREFGDLVRMIHDGHGLTFLPLEEANYYEQQAGLPADGFTIITFRDMPPGEKRYIMCSMQVEPGIIERLNAQIHFE